MKPRIIFSLTLCLVLLITAIGPSQAQGPEPQAPMGTAFTYQGQLRQSGVPVDGTCDFQFGLWNAASAGTQIGSTLTQTGVTVTRGLFTVPLDFGASPFQGEARYLESAVRCPSGSGSYTTLSPRQALTPVPYALYAATAPWTGLLGIPAGFADGADNDTTYTAGTGLTLAGTQFSVNFAGTGSANTAARSDHTHAGAYWSLTGNAGANPATNFLGTTDAVTLTLAVSGTAALRLDPGVPDWQGYYSPNVIAGDAANSVAADLQGATISGGGIAFHYWQAKYGNVYLRPNKVTDNFGTVGGGLSNEANGYAATVGGGEGNLADNWYATVAGGGGSPGIYAFGNVAGGFASTVGGGQKNYAGRFATVSGGFGNSASADYATIGGGGHPDPYALYENPFGPDEGNRVTDKFGTISGGGNNQAGDGAGTSDDQPFATVGGGWGNTASGAYATIPGGELNTAEGDYSFAAGRRAKALHDGSFVWADSEDADFASMAANQFLVRAAGGATLSVAENQFAVQTGGGVDTLIVSRNQFLAQTGNVAALRIPGGGLTLLRGHDSGGLHRDSGAEIVNIIGGWSGNYADEGVVGATIAGGGADSMLYLETPARWRASPNIVWEDFGTVGGGLSNQTSGYAATVAGGEGNIAGGDYSTVSGGGGPGDAMPLTNYPNGAGGLGSTVSGGQGNTALGDHSTISGGYGNWVGGDSGTIAGGGGGYGFYFDEGNSVFGNYGAIGGGQRNIVTGTHGTVAGGLNDIAEGDYSNVGGGKDNLASHSYTAIGGGLGNKAQFQYAVVGGGLSNTASGDASVVGGGAGNRASGLNATVAGGNDNRADGERASVGGGRNNNAANSGAAVGGGLSNTASGWGATVSGGNTNTAGAHYATVGGGASNTASGTHSTVPGGYNNTAAGTYSFAAGQRAKANANGCFVWGDYTSADVICSTANAWVARASGGVTFFTNGAMTTGVRVAAGGGSWSSVSDRNLKDNFSVVDPLQILQRLAEIPITTWNYKSQDASIRHIGPVAQDFYAAFGVGEDNKSITTVDADGVALAAIQGLNQISQGQASRIQQLETENAAQKEQISDLESRIAALEALVAKMAQSGTGGEK